MNKLNDEKIDYLQDAFYLWLGDDKGVDFIEATVEDAPDMDDLDLDIEGMIKQFEKDTSILINCFNKDENFDELVDTLKDRAFVWKLATYEECVY